MPPPRGDIIPTTADEEFEDGRVRNAEAVTKIRDAWIYTQISARAKEFTQYRNVSSLLNRGRILLSDFVNRTRILMHLMIDGGCMALFLLIID
jgi:hypothetical protein